MGSTGHRYALGLTCKARCCNRHSKSEDHKNFWRALVAGNNDLEKEVQERLYNTIRDIGSQEVIKTLSDPGHWEK